MAIAGALLVMMLAAEPLLECGQAARSAEDLLRCNGGQAYVDKNRRYQECIRAVRTADDQRRCSEELVTGDPDGLAKARARQEQDREEQERAARARLEAAAAKVRAEREEAAARVAEAAEAEKRKQEAKAAAEQEQERLAGKAKADRQAAERAAALVKGKKPHLGPLGLLWGQPIPEVKAVLAERLEFEQETEVDDGASYMLRYSGTLAGYPCDSIEVIFFEDRLFAVAAILSSTPARPAHRRWESAVKTMKEAYGAPSEGGKIPESPAARLAKKAAKDTRPPSMLYAAAMSPQADDAWLAQEVLAGRWTPKATWSFPDSEVSLAATVREERSGGADVEVVWAFYEKARLKAWLTASDEAKKKSRDF